MDELVAELGRRIVCIRASDGMGTGFLVSPVDVVTARHVIEETAPEEIVITGMAWAGIRKGQAFSFYPDETVDLALVHLPTAGGADASCCFAVPAGKVRPATVGDEVTLVGFSREGSDHEIDTALIVGFDGAASVQVLNKAVPRGFSGGPVLVNGHLAGLVFARRQDAGRGYIVPGDELVRFIGQHARGNLARDETAFNPLRAFPLGPAVPGATVFALAHRLIEAYTQLFPEMQAMIAVGQANKARMECGPPTTRAGIVQAGDVGSPFFNLALFWQNVFSTAGLKSPRMLAAIAMLADDEQLTEEQRRERTALLAVLRDWRGQ